MSRVPLAALLVAVAAVGCGDREPDDGNGDRDSGGARGTVLELVLSQEFRSFDPAEAVSVIDALVQRQVLESLVEYDPETPPLGLRGLLAESWESSADGLRWTFRLREDLYFHDPAPEPLWPGGKRRLTAHDVVASWLRIADPHVGADGSWALEGLIVGLDEFAARLARQPEQARSLREAVATAGLEGLRAVDDHTLEVVLTYADPDILHRFAVADLAVVPHELELAAGRSYRDTPIGSGPYAIHSLSPGIGVEYRRVADWRGQQDAAGRELASIGTLKFTVVDDAQTRLQLFRAGVVPRFSVGPETMASVLPDGALAPELAAEGITLHRASLPDLTTLVFDMRDPTIGEVPGDDEGNRRRTLLRRAIAAAFPYAEWAEVVRTDGLLAEPARSWLPPQLAEADALAEFPWRGGVEEAAALLEEAGWPGGEGAPKLTYVAGPENTMYRSIGVVLRQAMAGIGLELEVELEPEYALVRERAVRGEVMLMTRAWVLDWPSGALMYDQFLTSMDGSGVNLAHFRDEGFDALYGEYRAETDPGRRRELAADLGALLDERVPSAPIDHRHGYLLVQPWLEGFRLHPFDPYPCKNWRLAENR